MKSILHSRSNLYLEERSTSINIMKASPELSMTHRFYVDNAESYFASTVDLELEELWSSFEDELSKDSRVLDLGSGSGRDTRHFSKRGFNVIGIDHSYPLLNLAKNHFDLPFVNGDFSSLPFSSNSFDAIWAAACLLHVPDQLLPGSLIEMHRILRCGGTLFTSIKKGKGEEIDAKGRFFKYYQKEDWLSELQKHQFKIERVFEQTEVRELLNGTQEPVNWIACIARAE